MAILVMDLALFVIFTSTGLIGGEGPREASPATAEHLLASNGRFALVDEAGEHTGIYRTLGEPNMNVFTHMASVQGYGALISTIYDNATGTHPQAVTERVPLGRRDLHAAAPRRDRHRLDGTDGKDRDRTQDAGDVRAPGAGATVRRYFGRRMKVEEIVLTARAGTTLSSSPITLRLLNGSGHEIGRVYSPTATTSSDKVDFDFTAPPFAAGFEVTSASGVLIGDAVVTPSHSKWSYELDYRLRAGDRHARSGISPRPKTRSRSLRRRRSCRARG